MAQPKEEDEKSSTRSHRSQIEDDGGSTSVHAWGIVVDPAKSSKNNLGAYIIEKAELYKEGDESGEEAWIRYKEDFEGFTADSFKKPGSLPAQKLRNILLEKGVFIKKDGKSIANHLAELLDQEEYVEWPSDVKHPTVASAKTRHSEKNASRNPTNHSKNATNHFERNPSVCTKTRSTDFTKKSRIVAKKLYRQSGDSEKSNRRSGENKSRRTINDSSANPRSSYESYGSLTLLDTIIPSFSAL